MSGNNSGETTTTVPWAEQQPYLQDLLARSGRFVEQGTPNLTGATSAATNAVQNYRNAVAPTQNIAADAANQQSFLANGVLNPAANPALQDYIALANKQTTDAFNQNVLPGLKSSAVQAGNVGSSRAGIAEGLAAQGLQQQIGTQTAGLTSQAYGQGLDAYMKGLALAPQTAQLQQAPGALQQQISSVIAGLETLPQDQQLQLLQAYQGLITGNYGGETTGPGYQTGGLSGALGGAGTGAVISDNNPWAIGIGALAGYLS